jgi:hypothetical protein
LAAFALLSPSEVSARGIVLVTWGETISHVGEASPQAGNMHGSNKVGYKYGYWGVFWVDLWTHGGTYCIYEGKRYNPISPAEAARLLGRSEDELSTPFLYRIPLGWLIFGPLIVIGIIAAVREKGSGNEIALLFEDPRYQKALEVLNEQYSKPPAAAEPEQGAGAPAAAEPEQGAGAQATTDDESRFRAAFEAGVQHLIGAGIPREEAERNLATMLQILTQAQEQEAAAPAN